jgi:glucose-1-phosphate cytidylyltransferase
MKVLILAGGYGTRLSEETSIKPKPMVEIGGRPILWHIMKTYSQYGLNDFVILLGYKGYIIKEYFANYFLHESDVEIDLEKNSMSFLNARSEPWKVTLLDTGTDTMTGGRVKRAEKIVGKNPFMLSYGDGLADINIMDLIKFHNSHTGHITMTSAQPDGRFGALEIAHDNKILKFSEKPKGDGSWVNAGYFVCNPEVFSTIVSGDETIFEQEPLQNLARGGHAYTYKHSGFWMPMDTLRDKNKLVELWEENKAPWKTWD